MNEDPGIRIEFDYCRPGQLAVRDSGDPEHSGLALVVLEFDFSANVFETRRRRIPDKTHHDFRVRRAAKGIRLRLGRRAHDVAVDGMPELFQHLLLKQMLNIHSTLVMGRLGRYQNNLMTWVTPSNGKLVDRATVYNKIRKYHLEESTSSGGTGSGGSGSGSTGSSSSLELNISLLSFQRSRMKTW